MTEHDGAQEGNILRLTDEEWKIEGRRILSGWTGDLRVCINFLNQMDKKRAELPVPVEKPITQFDIDFSIWKDMIEEPEKYGDDIVEWLELDDKLAAGSGRWRTGAYWCQAQQEKDTKEWNRVMMLLTNAMDEYKNRMATRIQSAIRGHITRNNQSFRDCCMCLSHRISPLTTDVGSMCHGCAKQGPYTEETGPLSDPWDWFRSDFSKRKI